MSIAESKERKPPIGKIKVGGVTLTVWENISPKGGTYRSFTPQRSYKDKAGEWQNTHSFGVSDLPKLILACQEAYRNELIKEEASALAVS